MNTRYHLNYYLLSIKNLHDLKNQIDNLKKEIEKIVHEYVIIELRIIQNQSEGTTGINIQGTIEHYLEYFYLNNYYERL